MPPNLIFLPHSGKLSLNIYMVCHTPANGALSSSSGNTLLGPTWSPTSVSELPPTWNAKDVKYVVTQNLLLACSSTLCKCPGQKISQIPKRFPDTANWIEDLPIIFISIRNTGIFRLHTSWTRFWCIHILTRTIFLRHIKYDFNSNYPL